MIRFTKMHGLGNDYVFIDSFTQRVDRLDLPALARDISDRHRGVGSDGLILIAPPAQSADADARMEMYNADGSRGEMCGNGIRCVAKYLIDRGLASAADASEPRTLRIQTDRGVLSLEAFSGQGGVDAVRVDMDPPILEPRNIPVRVPGNRCIKAELPVGSQRHIMTCVSMGNPHAVLFVPSVDAIDLAQLGPLVERHELFPNGVNLHVAAVLARDEATMRTWERGSGLTEACGTGACAVLVAGVLEDRLGRSATIHLPGGDLQIEWSDSPDGVSGSVFMTGPAVEIFSGEWPT
jgi:diaminopimelate epimerase